MREYHKKCAKKNATNANGESSKGTLACRKPTRELSRRAGDDQRITITVPTADVQVSATMISGYWQLAEANAAVCRRYPRDAMLPCGLGHDGADTHIARHA